MSKKALLQITTAAAIILVAAALFVFYSSRSSNNNSAKTSTESAVIGTNSIKVNNQPVSSKIIVSEAVLANPGFVVVRLINEGDIPGIILGNSKYLKAGISKNVEITIYDPTKIKAGNTLMVTLLRDEGNQIYGRADTELLVRDSSKKVIFKKFTLE